YVIDVSGGEKIPRKGGPGITRSDLLVINKIDLAPYVGASLGVMARDAAAFFATSAGSRLRENGASDHRRYVTRVLSPLLGSGVLCRRAGREYGQTAVKSRNPLQLLKDQKLLCP